MTEPGQVEQYLLGTWTLSFSLLSVIGNSFVLRGIKHLRLDRITKVFIKHLAVADILNSLGNLIIAWFQFTKITFFQDMALYCKFHTRYVYILGSMDIFFVAAINVSKVHILVYPMDARSRQRLTGELIAAAGWLFHTTSQLIATIYSYVTNTGQGFFARSWYQCTILGMNKRLNFINVLIGVVIPTITVLGSTIWMLQFVRRRVQGYWATILMPIMVSAVFFFSFTPFTITNVYRTNYEGQPELEQPWFILSARYAMCLVIVNYCANPLIYFFTIRSFKDWCLKLVGMSGEPDHMPMTRSKEGTSTQQGGEKRAASSVL